jgi:hypothetical protein
MARKPDLSSLKIRGHVADAQRSAASDAAERKRAEKIPGSIILGKGDVQGDYDAARVLTTTLGGLRRVLTAEDLATFRHNLRTVQAKLTSTGITARQVLDFARNNPLNSPEGGSDLTRANQQIRVAIPASAIVRQATPNKALDVRFITNAGPDSRVSRHNVLVRFLGFAESARALQGSPTVADAKDKRPTTPKQAATRMRAGYLAFDCDCERHRYFFRFVTTIGGFNAGRDEHGYPKIKNPGLHGVTCKHVLRVMAEVNSSNTVLGFLTRALESAMRSSDNLVRVQTKESDARALAAKQAARPRAIAPIAKVRTKSPASAGRLTRLPNARNADQALKAFMTQNNLSAEQVLALLQPKAPQ